MVFAFAGDSTTTRDFPFKLAALFAGVFFTGDFFVATAFLTKLKSPERVYLSVIRL